MKLVTVAATLALAAAALAPVAQAQTTGQSDTAQAPASAGPAPRRGPMGPHGPGPMMGHWGSRYTPGWSMMTPQERDAHRAAMRNARTYDECRKTMDEHRDLMQQRAKERGVTMPGPRRDACAGLPRR